MHEVRKDYVEAERLYRKALEVDPNEANVMGNFAQFLAGTERLEEAENVAIQAWELLDNVPAAAPRR